MFALFALFALFFDSARRRIDCKWISIVKVRTICLNLCGKSIAHLFCFGKSFRWVACTALVSLVCVACLGKGGQPSKPSVDINKTCPRSVCPQSLTALGCFATPAKMGTGRIRTFNQEDKCVIPILSLIITFCFELSLITILVQLKTEN